MEERKRLIKNVKTDLCISGYDIAQRFREFFVQEIFQIKETIPVEHFDLNSVYYPQANVPLNSFHATDLEELHKLISCSGNKYCSLDPMTTELIRQTGDELMHVLLHLVNRSFRGETFQIVLKKH